MNQEKRIKHLQNLFKKHSSKESPIKVKEIVNLMRNMVEKDEFILPKYSSRQFRVDIQEIRRNNTFGKQWVVSGNFGYYLTSDIKEIIKWQKRYESYIIDMAKTLKGLKKRPEFFNYKLGFLE
jgi:hypothetical protein